MKEEIFRKYRKGLVTEIKFAKGGEPGEKRYKISLAQIQHLKLRKLQSELAKDAIYLFMKKEFPDSADSREENWEKHLKDYNKSFIQF
ncbi:hypothetical protein TWF730_006369 [Orbilia blumenaviensis]|uniref:Uncharacterized protein n=1 Tax=Orbilia blumenaviensis TaxID=1796055 RepID=A0AAV9VEH5_9PEZI